MSQIDDQVNDIVARSEAVAAELAAFANSALNIVIPDANTAIPGVFETILVGSDNDNNIGPAADATLKVITDQTTPYDDNPIFVTYSGSFKSGGVISVRKARGSQANVQPLEDGDIVGGLFASGHDGTDFQFSSGLRFKVDGVVNAAATVETPMKIVMETKDETGSFAERLVVNPAGNIGIGTSEPTALLDIRSESSVSVAIDGNTGTQSLRYRSNGITGARIASEAVNQNLIFDTGGTGNEAMRIDSGGNVGIGTSNPDKLLTLEDDGPVQLRFRQRNDVNEWFQIAQNGSNQAAFKSSANGAFGEYLFIAEDGTSSVTRMVIDSIGNVGFGGAPTGISTNATTLQLKGAVTSKAGGIRLVSSDESEVAYFYKDSTNGLYIAAQTGNQQIRFLQGSTAVMTINSTGKVGIGTASPDWIASGTQTSQGVLSLGTADTAVVTGDVIGALSFVTPDGSYTGVYSDGVGAQIAAVTESAVGGAFGLAISTGTTTGTNRAERVRIDAVGRVGIGKTNTEGLSLEVQAPTGFSVGSGFYTASTQSTITFSDSATTAAYKVRVGSEGDDLLMFAGGSERMRIDASGNVLTPWTNIGTTQIGVSRRDTNVFSTNTHELVLNGADAITGAQAMGGGSVRIRGGDGVGTAGGSAGDVIIQGGDVGDSGSAGTTAGIIKFETGSPTATERMRIDSIGRVMVGTDTYGYGPVDFHVGSTSDTQNGIAIQSSNTGYGYLLFGDGSGTDSYVGQVSYSHPTNSMDFLTNNDLAMRIDANGDVKFATANDSAGTSKSLFFGTPSFNRAEIRCTNAATYDGSLEFYTGNAANFLERMRIDPNGKVGIGSTNPLAPLEVIGPKYPNGSFDTVGHFYSSDALGDDVGAFIAMGGKYDATNVTGFAAIGGVKADGVSSNFGGEMVFKTRVNGGSMAERMRINESGNVGIASADPLSRLDVVVKVASSTNRPTYKGTICISDYGNATSLDGGLEFHSNSGGGAGYGSLLFPLTDGSLGFATRTNSATWSDRMRIDANGKLLVGKSVAAGVTSVGFEVDPLGITYTSYNSSSPCAHFNRGSNGLGLQFYVGTVDAGGVTFTQNGTPSFASASDERLKDNITDHESELANVMALRPVRWDWKSNDNSGEGFIAQELQETAWADLVSEGDDGMLQVSGLGTVETRLIKAMQEQQAMIEALKAEVESLKNA